MLDNRPSVELFELIAEEYANGLPLYAIADKYTHVPGARTLQRWKREYRAFAELLRDAEAVRAERLAEESLGIADRDQGEAGKTAAEVKNQLAVRDRLMTALDPARWGKSPAVSVEVNTPSSQAPDISRATSAQLWAMLQQRGAFIDLDAEQKEGGGGEGVHPPLAEEAGVGEREADPPPPKSIPLADSTENGITKKFSQNSDEISEAEYEESDPWSHIES